MASRPVAFTVEGLPAPWTSPRRGRGGGSIPTKASGRMKAWQDRVKLAATAAMRGRRLIDGPVGLMLDFTMWEDGESWIQVDNYDPEPHLNFKKPDLTNLIKATEDALSGIVFKDDCQVTWIDARKWNKACPTVKPRRSQKS